MRVSPEIRECLRANGQIGVCNRVQQQLESNHNHKLMRISEHNNMGLKPRHRTTERQTHGANLESPQIHHTLQYRITQGSYKGSSPLCPERIFAKDDSAVLALLE
jgi:hypothetical protein